MLVYVVISADGQLVGCYSSPIDAHESARAHADSSVSQCHLNSEVATAPDCVHSWTRDPRGPGEILPGGSWTCGGCGDMRYGRAEPPLW